MTGHFEDPVFVVRSDIHHASAAARNAAVSQDASRELLDVLSGVSPSDRIFLKAAAGAGKSYALTQLVAEANAHPAGRHIAVVAFTNKQIHPLALSLGNALGADRVCLLSASDRLPDIPADVFGSATVVTSASQIPSTTCVVVATCSRLGVPGERNRLLNQLGVGANGSLPFDVLFVDEAWQIPNHLFDQVSGLAPKWVAVGDVGQLPPLEVGENPWRGDRTYNPYRAWPTEWEGDARTWAKELPSVWRPAAGHLALWQAFYPEWGQLDCVAAAGDRSLDFTTMSEGVAEIWRQVGTGVPTLLEVDGLPEPEAPDIDLPLMRFIEALLDEFFASDVGVLTADYDDDGAPRGTIAVRTPRDVGADPIVAILATRNQAVDDAADVVQRLREKHDLTEHDIVSSTVDSYQGRTNLITVAVHPLNGAAELDSFNSAFGRLAVTCTRATHGLLLVTRPGLDDLLQEAPARPGTPFGEPGNRQLPRQTHQRIIATFARGRILVSGDQ